MPCEVPRGRNSAGTDRTIGTKYILGPQAARQTGDPRRLAGGSGPRGWATASTHHDAPQKHAQQRPRKGVRVRSTEYLVARCKYSHFAKQCHARESGSIHWCTPWTTTCRPGRKDRRLQGLPSPAAARAWSHLQRGLARRGPGATPGSPVGSLPAPWAAIIGGRRRSRATIQ